MNQGHACGHNLASWPSPPALWRAAVRWLSVLPTGRQRLACPLDIKAQPSSGPVPQPHASQPLGIGVDPVAGDAELLGQAPSVDKAYLRTCRGHELSYVLCYGLDLLDVRSPDPPTARRKEFDLPRDNESDM